MLSVQVHVYVHGKYSEHFALPNPKSDSKKLGGGGHFRYKN